MQFQRLGQGLMGQGVAFQAEFNGPQRFDQAKSWWAEVTERATIHDPVNRPGSGLAAFSTFTFDQGSRHNSVIIIPQTIYGVDELGSFETRLSADRKPAAPLVVADTVRTPRPADGWTEGTMSEKRFVEVCSLATEKTAKGSLHKVVIARDLIRGVPDSFSLARSTQWLTEAYPDTHVFLVDGLFGASPETLASVRDGRIHLRVLAGSAARGSDPVKDADNAQALATNTKDLDEHGFAVRNVLDSLDEAGVHGIADNLPFALKLPNLWHLATDITGAVPPGANGLDIIRALHPTAAVAGTPTDNALSFIGEHELVDRGRYAGPVGWLDAKGNGEWALAIRCAQFDATESVITAYAGAGIVNGSDPETELRETELKFRPIIQAVEATLK